jgi:hypothetical protein
MSRTPRSGGEHRSRILDVAEHRGILTETGPTSSCGSLATASEGGRLTTSENAQECSNSAVWLVVRRLSRVRRSRSRSAAFSALAAAQWRIFVRHVIAASAIAPTYARTRLGVERSASQTGVTKAVSAGASSTLNGRVDIVSDAGA